MGSWAAPVGTAGAPHGGHPCFSLRRTKKGKGSRSSSSRFLLVFKVTERGKGTHSLLLTMKSVFKVTAPPGTWGTGRPGASSAVRGGGPRCTETPSQAPRPCLGLGAITRPGACGAALPRKAAVRVGGVNALPGLRVPARHTAPPGRREPGAGSRADRREEPAHSGTRPVRRHAGSLRQNGGVWRRRTPRSRTIRSTAVSSSSVTLWEAERAEVTTRPRTRCRSLGSKARA